MNIDNENPLFVDQAGGCIIYPCHLVCNLSQYFVVEFLIFMLNNIDNLFAYQAVLLKIPSLIDLTLILQNYNLMFENSVVGEEQKKKLKKLYGPFL